MYYRDFVKLHVEPGDILGIEFKDKTTAVLQFEEIERIGKPYFLRGICHAAYFVKKLKLIQMEKVEILRKNINLNGTKQ
jgi:hypothetical protein